MYQSVNSTPTFGSPRLTSFVSTHDLKAAAASSSSSASSPSQLATLLRDFDAASSPGSQAPVQTSSLLVKSLWPSTETRKDRTLDLTSVNELGSKHQIKKSSHAVPQHFYPENIFFPPSPRMLDLSQGRSPIEETLIPKSPGSPKAVEVDKTVRSSSIAKSPRPVQTAKELKPNMESPSALMLSSESSLDDAGKRKTKKFGKVTNLEYFEERDSEARLKDTSDNTLFFEGLPSTTRRRERGPHRKDARQWQLQDYPAALRLTIDPLERRRPMPEIHGLAQVLNNPSINIPIWTESSTSIDLDAFFEPDVSQAIHGKNVLWTLVGTVTSSTSDTLWGDGSHPGLLHRTILHIFEVVETFNKCTRKGDVSVPPLSQGEFIISICACEFIGEERKDLMKVIDIDGIVSERDNHKPKLITPQDEERWSLTTLLVSRLDQCLECVERLRRTASRLRGEAVGGVVRHLASMLFKGVSADRVLSSIAAPHLLVHITIDSKWNHLIKWKKTRHEETQRLREDIQYRTKNLHRGTLTILELGAADCLRFPECRSLAPSHFQIMDLMFQLCSRKCFAGSEDKLWGTIAKSMLTEQVYALLSNSYRHSRLMTPLTTGRILFHVATMCTEPAVALGFLRFCQLVTNEKRERDFEDLLRNTKLDFPRRSFFDLVIKRENGTLPLEDVAPFSCFGKPMSSSGKIIHTTPQMIRDLKIPLAIDPYIIKPEGLDKSLVTEIGRTLLVKMCNVGKVAREENENRGVSIGPPAHPSLASYSMIANEQSNQCPSYSILRGELERLIDLKRQQRTQTIDHFKSIAQQAATSSYHPYNYCARYRTLNPAQMVTEEQSSVPAKLDSKEPTREENLKQVTMASTIPNSDHGTSTSEKALSSRDLQHTLMRQMTQSEVKQAKSLRKVLIANSINAQNSGPFCELGLADSTIPPATLTSPRSHGSVSMSPRIRNERMEPIANMKSQLILPFEKPTNSSSLPTHFMKMHSPFSRHQTDVQAQVHPEEKDLRCAPESVPSREFSMGGSQDLDFEVRDVEPQRRTSVTFHRSSTNTPLKENAFRTHPVPALQTPSSIASHCRPQEPQPIVSTGRLPLLAPPPDARRSSSPFVNDIMEPNIAPPLHSLPFRSEVFHGAPRPLRVRIRLKPGGKNRRRLFCLPRSPAWTSNAKSSASQRRFSHDNSSRNPESDCDPSSLSSNESSESYENSETDSSSEASSNSSISKCECESRSSSSGSEWSSVSNEDAELSSLETPAEDSFSPRSRSNTIQKDSTIMSKYTTSDCAKPHTSSEDSAETTSIIIPDADSLNPLGNQNSIAFFSSSFHSAGLLDASASLVPNSAPPEHRVVSGLKSFGSNLLDSPQSSPIKSYDTMKAPILKEFPKIKSAAGKSESESSLLSHGSTSSWMTESEHTTKQRVRHENMTLKTGGKAEKPSDVSRTSSSDVSDPVESTLRLHEKGFRSYRQKQRRRSRLRELRKLAPMSLDPLKRNTANAMENLMRKARARHFVEQLRRQGIPLDPCLSEDPEMLMKFVCSGGVGPIDASGFDQQVSIKPGEVPVNTQAIPHWDAKLFRQSVKDMAGHLAEDAFGQSMPNRSLYHRFRQFASQPVKQECFKEEASKGHRPKNGTSYMPGTQTKLYRFEENPLVVKHDNEAVDCTGHSERTSLTEAVSGKNLHVQEEILLACQALIERSLPSKHLNELHRSPNPIENVHHSSKMWPNTSTGTTGQALAIGNTFPSKLAVNVTVPGGDGFSRQRERYPKRKKRERSSLTNKSRALLPLRGEGHLTCNLPRQFNGKRDMTDSEIRAMQAKISSSTDENMKTSSSKKWRFDGHYGLRSSDGDQRGKIDRSIKGGTSKHASASSSMSSNEAGNSSTEESEILEKLFRKLPDRYQKRKKARRRSSGKGRESLHKKKVLDDSYSIFDEEEVPKGSQITGINPLNHPLASALGMPPPTKLPLGYRPKRPFACIAQLPSDSSDDRYADDRSQTRRSKFGEEKTEELNAMLKYLSGPTYFSTDYAGKLHEAVDNIEKEIQGRTFELKRRHEARTKILSRVKIGLPPATMKFLSQSRYRRALLKHHKEPPESSSDHTDVFSVENSSDVSIPTSEEKDPYAEPRRFRMEELRKKNEASATRVVPLRQHKMKPWQAYKTKEERELDRTLKKYEEVHTDTKGAEFAADSKEKIPEKVTAKNRNQNLLMESSVQTDDEGRRCLLDGYPIEEASVLSTARSDGSVARSQALGRVPGKTCNVQVISKMEENAICKSKGGPNENLDAKDTFGGIFYEKLSSSANETSTKTAIRKFSNEAGELPRPNNHASFRMVPVGRTHDDVMPRKLIPKIYAKNYGFLDQSTSLNYTIPKVGRASLTIESPRQVGSPKKNASESFVAIQNLCKSSPDPIPSLPLSGMIPTPSNLPVNLPRISSLHGSPGLNLTATPVPLSPVSAASPQPMVLRSNLISVPKFAGQGPIGSPRMGLVSLQMNSSPHRTPLGIRVTAAPDIKAPLTNLLDTLEQVATHQSSRPRLHRTTNVCQSSIRAEKKGRSSSESSDFSSRLSKVSFTSGDAAHSKSPSKELVARDKIATSHINITKMVSTCNHLATVPDDIEQLFFDKKRVTDTRRHSQIHRKPSIAEAAKLPRSHERNDSVHIDSPEETIIDNKFSRPDLRSEDQALRLLRRQKSTLRTSGDSQFWLAGKIDIEDDTEAAEENRRQQDLRQLMQGKYITHMREKEKERKKRESREVSKSLFYQKDGQHADEGSPVRVEDRVRWCEEFSPVWRYTPHTLFKLIDLHGHVAGFKDNAFSSWKDARGQMFNILSDQMEEPEMQQWRKSLREHIKTRDWKERVTQRDDKDKGRTQVDADLMDSLRDLFPKKDSTDSRATGDSGLLMQIDFTALASQIMDENLRILDKEYCNRDEEFTSPDQDHDFSSSDLDQDFSSPNISRTSSDKVQNEIEVSLLSDTSSSKSSRSTPSTSQCNLSQTRSVFEYKSPAADVQTNLAEHMQESLSAVAEASEPPLKTSPIVNEKTKSAINLSIRSEFYNAESQLLNVINRDDEEPSAPVPGGGQVEKIVDDHLQEMGLGRAGSPHEEASYSDGHEKDMNVLDYRFAALKKKYEHGDSALPSFGRSSSTPVPTNLSPSVIVIRRFFSAPLSGSNNRDSYHEVVSLAGQARNAGKLSQCHHSSPIMHMNSHSKMENGRALGVGNSEKRETAIRADFPTLPSSSYDRCCSKNPSPPETKTAGDPIPHCMSLPNMHSNTQKSSENGSSKDESSIIWQTSKGSRIPRWSSAPLAASDDRNPSTNESLLFGDEGFTNGESSRTSLVPFINPSLTNTSLESLDMETQEENRMLPALESQAEHTQVPCKVAKRVAFAKSTGDELNFDNLPQKPLVKIRDEIQIPPVDSIRHSFTMIPLGHMAHFTRNCGKLQSPKQSTKCFRNSTYVAKIFIRTFPQQSPHHISGLLPVRTSEKMKQRLQQMTSLCIPKIFNRTFKSRVRDKCPGSCANPAIFKRRNEMKLKPTGAI